MFRYIFYNNNLIFQMYHVIYIELACETFMTRTSEASFRFEVRKNY